MILNGINTCKIVIFILVLKEKLEKYLLSILQNYLSKLSNKLKQRPKNKYGELFLTVSIELFYFLR